MYRLVASTILLFTPSLAWADMGPGPGRRFVPVVVTLTLAQDDPGVEFFLVRWAPPEQVERLPLTASGPVCVSPDGRTLGQPFSQTSGSYLVWTVHAVPKARLTPFAGVLPPHSWFTSYPANAACLGTLSLKNAVPFYDTREQIEITYRVENGPSGWELVKVSENAGDPAVKQRWVVAGVVFATGLVGAGLLVMRLSIRVFAALARRFKSP